MSSNLNEDKIKVAEKSFRERQSELIGRFYDELWIANDMKPICANHFHSTKCHTGKLFCKTFL